MVDTFATLISYTTVSHALDWITATVLIKSEGRRLTIDVCGRAHPLRKQGLFKYIENSATKKWKCSDKNSDIFHISAKKYRLWLLVRTASLRWF